MLKLIGTDEQRYYTWDLEPGTYIVGRKSDCALSITDKTVSRNHAELTVEADGQTAWLTDLGSHNGTAVNGEAVSDRMQIRPGDRIQFGHTDFKFTADDDGSFQTSGPRPALLAEREIENSVFMSMAEVMEPLPLRVADQPELLPTIFDMAKMLVLPEPKEVMLERSLELVSKIIPSDRLAVLLTSDDQSEVYAAACRLSQDKDPGAFSLSKTILADILTNKNAILIGDVREDPRFAGKESIISSDLRSAMAVPLFDEDKVFGLLYADTGNPLHRYSDDFLRLFAMIGNIIASRLANFALLQERQEKQIYEAELERAALIQKSLVADSFPDVPGYAVHAVQEQCRAVGGDLYDLTTLPDGRLLFLLADVSGKGMGAALLMSNILASFRILYEDDDFDLIRTVHQVSIQLFKHSTSENFATLFVGLLDPQNHRIDFVNAGHNPPLLVRTDGSLKHLDPSGTMIGAFDFSTWQVDTVNIEPGDTLLVFTDGVTEAGIEDEEYSDERLEEKLVEHRQETPRRLTRTIMVDVDEFVGDAPRSDDITMIAIQRNA